MRAYLALATAMIMIGTNIPLGKLIVEEIPPASFAMLRFTLSSLCLIPLALTETPCRSSLTALGPRQWGELTLLSLFGVVGFTTLMLLGIQYTSAISAGIISSALPAVIALLSYFILREHVSPRKALSIALAVAGIAILNLSGPSAHAGTNGHASWNSSLLGNGLVFAAICSEGIFAILTRRYSSKIPPWTLTAIVHIIAIPLTLPILIWQDGAWLIPENASFGFWSMTAYYLLTASILSFYLWCYGIASTPASTAALFTALVPATSLIIAVAVLGEHLTILQVLGLAAVLASLAMGLKPPHKSKAMGR